MPFSKEYIPLIEQEEGVAKSLIRPRNIYKINSYTYKDGRTKSLSGTETAYVFVTGISPTKIISAIKISLVKPKDFFRWLKRLYRAGLTESYVNDSERLEDILILDNKDGKKIFNQFVKASRLYTQAEPTFRTYILNNVKNAELVSIKKEVLVKYIK
jgi:hypothetical protein